MSGKTWEQIARVAKGMQLDDPVNWPHYADEACKLVEENELAHERLTREGMPTHDDDGKALSLALRIGVALDPPGAQS